MAKERHTSKYSTIILPATVVLYLISSLSFNRYIRFTADSTLYVDIAEKYLRGEFGDAINGYWGPLLSWIIIPFLYLGFSDVYTINIIVLVFGVLTIIGIWRLSSYFGLSAIVRGVVLFASLFIIVYYSLGQPFDLILTCILLYYLTIVFDPDYPDRRDRGYISGLLGSLAYFTKSYAFPFFIIHFSIINLLHYIRVRERTFRRNIVVNTIAGFAVFSLISGLWIAVISNKYGHLTFSNMGKTNFAILAPGAPEDNLEFGQPMFYKGFFEPPNKSATSAWEDPSYIDVKTWSPLESWETFIHFIKRVIKNLSDVIRIYGSFSTLSVVIIICYLFFLLDIPYNKVIHHGGLLYPLLTVFIYTGGYMIFHLEDRYLWIVNVLLMLMGGSVVERLLQIDFFRGGIKKNLLIIIFLISFIFSPSRSIIQISKGTIDTDMYYLARELKEYNIRGNIASNREYIPTHDAWHKTFRLAYWLDSRYYSQAKEGISDEELEDELRRYDIDYYFVWGNLYANKALLSKYREVTGGKIPGLKIFHLKEKSAQSE